MKLGDIEYARADIECSNAREESVARGGRVFVRGVWRGFAREGSVARGG